MKISFQSNTIAAALIATALCPLATLRAQAPVDYALAPSAVTMALVIKKTAPGTFERQEAGGSFRSPRVAAYSNDNWTTGPINSPTSFNSEYVSRIASTRYGNAQLLDDLVAEGVITNKVGWGVVLKYNAVSYPMTDDNGEPLLDDNGNQLEGESYEPVLALRKGTEIIEVDVQKANFVVNTRAYASAFSWSYSFATRTEVATGKGSGTTEGALSVIVTSPTLGSVELNGLLLASSSDFYWYPNPTNRSENDYINVPGNSRFTGLVGAEEFVDSEDDSSGPGVITGSITAAASKAIKK